MEYKIYQPNPTLLSLVDYYYYSVGTFDGVERTILPDGRVDLVFVLSAGVQLKDRQDDFHTVPGGVLQARKKEVFPVVYKGRVELLGIRFRPRGCRVLLGMPMSELPEQPVPMADVFNAEAKELEESLFEIPDPRDKISRVEQWLIHQYCKNDLKHHWEWDWLDKLMQSSGSVPLQILLPDSDANYKRVQRFFRDQLGITPKSLARMLRMDAIHQDLRMNNQQKVDWMSLVVKYGFYDQSHLVHEFQQLTGHSPEQFVAKLPQFI